MAPEGEPGLTRELSGAHGPLFPRGRDGRLSALLSGAVVLVLLLRGNGATLVRSLVRPSSARTPRPAPAGLEELAAAAKARLAANEAVLYDSPVRAEAADPNARRFGDGRPRPEADETKEWTRRLLAPHRVYARGAFEPPFPAGELPPRILVTVGATLANPGFRPIFENGAGGVYERVPGGGR